MVNSHNRSLQALKEILLSEDQERLNEFAEELRLIREQISDEEALIDTLDPVIASVLERKMVESRDEMADVLAPVMSEAIKRQISEAKDDMVDSLYPIIGKTIRKSVAEAMKGLVDNVNSKIEQALRKGLFFNRVKSRLTGVSEGEMIVKGAMPFRIQEIFLIHKASGLLISHVSSAQSGTTVDKDMISGMLTAIKDFVADAFKGDDDQELGEIQYGDLKILLEAGRYSYLALVISGVEPAEFKDDLSQLGRRIHNRFYKILRQFDGDMTSFKEIQRPIVQFLNKQNTVEKAAEGKKSKSYLIYFVLIAGLLVIGFFTLRYLPKFISGHKLSREIKNEIQHRLGYDDELRIVSRGDVVTIEGRVDSLAHIPAVAEIVGGIQGVREVRNRLRVARTNETIHNEIIRRLDSNERLKGFSPTFILDDDVVIVEGEVPDAITKREMAFLIDDIPGIRIINNNLTVNKDDVGLIENANAFLAERTIYFKANSTDIDDEQRRTLDEIVDFVKPLSAYALKICGYSDNTSTREYNLQISRLRAETVKNYLVSQGLSEDLLTMAYKGQDEPILPNDSEQGRSKNRRVNFKLTTSR
ncbi:MAG: OmpA family protein [candidate division KSB1 bacterium]|nr:OmpA family protein [candidate division KSB1 bacterium]